MFGHSRVPMDDEVDDLKVRGAWCAVEASAATTTIASRSCTGFGFRNTEEDDDDDDDDDMGAFGFTSDAYAFTPSSSLVSRPLREIFEPEDDDFLEREDNNSVIPSLNRNFAEFLEEDDVSDGRGAFLVGEPTLLDFFDQCGEANFHGKRNIVETCVSREVRKHKIIEAMEPEDFDSFDNSLDDALAVFGDLGIKRADHKRARTLAGSPASALRHLWGSRSNHDACDEEA